ncbi:MAG: hypothetical protein A3F11_09315 [Gammaproteobacteria bacterium RIFCSPHIGHO2_12_FULL_37_14]|nr:MAG: hypothetical protein A3F11_09315 [Gammaproteobacteria bacterium RIFCSPHIGHO2_12_FULL_37_14]
MKIRIILLSILLLCSQLTAHAADLIEVFQQALTSDPTYQQAIAQRLSTKQGVPINIAALLPNLSITANPTVTRSAFSGNNFDTNVAGVPLTPRNNTNLGYTLALTATQTVFDFAKFANVANALATSKGADATLNAALQSLMVRVSSAYFAVLKDEENLSYSEASKLAFAKQLDQIKQQYDVGLKTITDVYTAQASYDSAVATYIAAENAVDNDKENLRVITGKYYHKLSALRDEFPLITPEPVNIDAWTKIAEQQNWLIKASQYNVDASRQIIKQQFAGHLPTVDLEGTLNRVYSKDINGYNSINDPSGTGTTTNRAIAINLNVPLFSGGGVIANTNQASYNYQVAQQQLEQTIRNTINTTRQSYLGILSGISQIKADKQTIKSTISSLEGLEASYQVGTETLVNVLNQQQKVFQAQTEYATDRYAYVNSILALKQAAGTLRFDDLRAINAWLAEKARPIVNKHTEVHHENHY